MKMYSGKYLHYVQYWDLNLEERRLTIRKVAPSSVALVLTSKSKGKLIPKLSASVYISLSKPLHCFVTLPTRTCSSREYTCKQFSLRKRCYCPETGLLLLSTLWLKFISTLKCRTWTVMYMFKLHCRSKVSNHQDHTFCFCWHTRTTNECCPDTNRSIQK